jgi:hypothetical protein
MNHWFDDLTKQLAADTLSRRSVLAAATATLAAVATGTGWPRLLSAAALKTGATRVQLNGYKGVLPAPVKLKYGPCTLTSTGAALKHEMTSQTTSGGKRVVLHATRAFDTKGMTINKTVLIDGKQQFQITHVSTESSQAVRVTIGDAFGFKGAQLTSADGLKTLGGQVDGRAIIPFVNGSSKKLQFADGKPWNFKEPPGARDAVKAALAKASQDSALCGSQLGSAKPTAASGERHDEPQITAAIVSAIATVTGTGTARAAPGYSEYPAEGGQQISSINTNAYMKPACVACGNKCDPGAFTGFVDVVDCILSIFLFYDPAPCSACVKLTTDQEKCFEKCNADPACLGQLCIPRPRTAVAAIPTCNKGDICLKDAPGYCCPAGYPNVCVGGFSTDCPSYEAGCPPEDYNNFCCAQDSVCLTDSSPALSYNFKGGSIALCCPKERVCGTKVANPPNADAWMQVGTVYQGTCCPPGLVCAEAALPGMAGHRECCEASKVRGGKCCDGNWCGEQCCSGPCNGNKCADLCLNGYTTDGKCCKTGVACGKVCCPSGCADAATSTCGSSGSLPPPK